MNVKELITGFYEEFFNEHQIDAAEKYVAEDYVQHNPGVCQGRAGLIEAFRQKFILQPDFKLVIVKIIAEHDMAAVYLKNVDESGNIRCRVVDMYRIQDGKLAEHWDVVQPTILPSKK